MGSHNNERGLERKTSVAPWELAHEPEKWHSGVINMNGMVFEFIPFMPKPTSLGLGIYKYYSPAS